ncbi:MAG TPA: TRC40/GET3/ArsA family transport-energizing ATPase [Gemmatimonadaceae bacterium]|nr:TRC40/GET3/ArsA family transport-energizing ATPase [Gemmatimonadaceae bacterium]
MSGLDALLDLLPPRVLVCGKGGVGKTTCASALALRAATRGENDERTLLLSTDPAGSLGDAVGSVLGGSPTQLRHAPGLYAMQLDPAAAHSRFLAEWRETLVELFDRGTYLSREESAGLIDAALPGIDESMALLTLLDIEDAGWTRLVVDTAPTGHTLRLLELPESFEALLALLDAMQEKHRFMVHALTHRYREDDVDRFLESLRSRLERLRASLADPARFAAVLVVRAEELVVKESLRYAARLESMGLAPRAVLVNALSSELDAASALALREIERALPDVPRFEVQRIARLPVGIEGIRQWGDAVRARDEHIAAASLPTGSSNAAPARDTGLAALIPRMAPLVIVAGKGGVGKTTTACALAIALADDERRTLIVSTDPAPSISDALAQPIGDAIAPVAGVELLSAQQLDASAAFARFRERYRERVDRLFDSLMRGAMDAAHDRQVVRDLLALAPPGLDELYALTVLGELLAEGRFERIVVDPAPTGHLLRLLELPEQAVAWTHRLLRLMLDYREVVPLGDAAEELLAFARRTRALAGLLHDQARASVLVVSLDEPLVRDETVRLVERIGELGVAVVGVLWNRADDTHVAPLPLAPPLAQFESPVTLPSPRGVEALRGWSATWRSVPIGDH